jgi:hypothetical protein
MNAAIARGVEILNDMCTGSVKPDSFHVRGRRFDLGPKSGVTRGEFGEFGEWFAKEAGGEKDGEVLVVPERWRKFERPVEEDDLDRFPRRLEK